MGHRHRVISGDFSLRPFPLAIRPADLEISQRLFGFLRRFHHRLLAAHESRTGMVKLNDHLIAFDCMALIEWTTADRNLLFIIMLQGP